MGETDRNIHRSSTVVGRASTLVVSNQKRGMRDRASCALCFNLAKVAFPLLLAGLYVLISRISARSAKSRMRSRVQTRRSNYTVKERRLLQLMRHVGGTRPLAIRWVDDIYHTPQILYPLASR